VFTIAQIYARAARVGLTDPVVWTPAGGSPTALDGYFDASYSPVEGMEANRPCVRAPASVLPNARQGDVVTVGGVSYTVAEIALHTPDQNETLLWLRKAA